MTLQKLQDGVPVSTGKQRYSINILFAGEGQ